jgi:hypothetical protein
MAANGSCVCHKCCVLSVVLKCRKTCVTGYRGGEEDTAGDVQIGIQMKLFTVSNAEGSEAAARVKQCCDM